jgi:nicotinamide phosphoribosyltransferase
MKFLNETFQKDFFDRPKDEVCGEMKRELSMYLNTDYDVAHFEALHDLGYLPIHVKAIPEGTLVPIKVPVLTIKNTHPDFYWIPNYLETIISNLLWKPMTSATIAFQYRKVLTQWAEKTNPEAKEFVLWQGHDFSMRGMDSVDAVISSGMGHLTSFFGSDSLPAIYGARKYYGEEEFISGSVNATEHSVMCAGTKDDEVGTFRRLLTETYPTGILSVVSDTWDLWKVCTEHLVTLKEEILARDGKLVIRPDSGDPVDILCGKGIYQSGDRLLTNEEIVELIKFAQKNKSTLIINDLERNAFAHYSIKLLTKLFSKSYLVKNDAPLSVLRGFKKTEWKDIIQQSGAKNFSVKYKWAFRHQVIIYAN